MTGFKIAKLNELIDEIGEDAVKGIIADYSCPMNGDIDRFLKHDAITFSRMCNAVTRVLTNPHLAESLFVTH